MVGRTIEALHDCNIYHGELESEQEFRHVVINVSAPDLDRPDLLNGQASCYIVGFSEAVCQPSLQTQAPLLPLDSYPSEEIVGCDELAGTIIGLESIQPYYNKTPSAPFL